MVFQLVIGCSSVIAMIILRVLRTRVYSVVKCARPHNDLIGHQLWSLLILQLFDVVSYRRHSSCCCFTAWKRREVRKSRATRPAVKDTTPSNVSIQDLRFMD